MHPSDLCRAIISSLRPLERRLSHRRTSACQTSWWSVFGHCKRRRQHELARKQRALIKLRSQGSIYHRIIEDVIQSSHLDFEETGVDPQTLDELRSVCRPVFRIAANSGRSLYQSYSCSKTFFCSEFAHLSCFDSHIYLPSSLSVCCQILHRFGCNNHLAHFHSRKVGRGGELLLGVLEFLGVTLYLRPSLAL